MAHEWRRACGVPRFERRTRGGPHGHGDVLVDEVGDRVGAEGATLAGREQGPGGIGSAFGEPDAEDCDAVAGERDDPLLAALARDVYVGSGA